MNILIVDDDASVLRLLENILAQKTDHNIITANNGVVALEKYKKSEFEVIITDIRMPEMDGMQLLEEIKKMDSGKYTDVIMITGYADVKNSLEALKLGAYGYFKKPFKIQKILEIVERIANKNDIFKMD